MSIRKTKTKNCLKIRISEELTKHEVSKYHEKLQTYFDEPCDIQMNLQDVTECDTTGLQLLFSIKKTTENLDKTFTLDTISSAIKKTAEMNGFVLDNI